MKKIIITSMTLVNFKGIRNLKIEFDPNVTSIYGRNGSGKTTIFDAFTWVLFGKDSQDRKQFDIKTLDEKGNYIPKLPHEVTIEMTVDGSPVQLTRRFKEKWVKKRGQADEAFTGHEEERIYNQVPCNLKEWNEKISDICTEEVFKFITSPYYFAQQRTDAQRSLLIRMAGGVSNEEIANGNEEFEKVASLLTGKTIEELKKEIAAKKRPIKEDVETLPERIDERKRDVVHDPAYYDEIEVEIGDKQAQLKQVEKQIADHAKAYSSAQEKRMKVIKKIAQLKQEKLQVEFDNKQKLMKGYNDEVTQQSILRSKVDDIKRKFSIVTEQNLGLKDELKARMNKRTELIAEWRKINAEEIHFNDNDFVCPTCHRPFEIDDIEAKQKEMTDNFNAVKSQKLKDNNAKGQANKKQMELLKADIYANDNKLHELNAKLDELTGLDLYTKKLVEPQLNDADFEDDRTKDITEQISQLEKETANEVVAPDNSELTQQKTSLNNAISELKSKLAMREVEERNKKRIEELEKQLRTQSDELAKYERLEFAVQKFSKARIEAIEGKINAMFKYVRFKMFETQINGGEVETCEATVNGVPYSSLNHAGQVNAGLDIINAICQKEGISAPIFFDNAESVNEIIPTNSQVIRLVVSTDKDLKVVTKDNRDLFNK